MKINKKKNTNKLCKHLCIINKEMGNLKGSTFQMIKNIKRL